MRAAIFVLASAGIVGTGCGSSKNHDGSLADAPPALDAAIDAELDALPAYPNVLLAGGIDVATQGWKIAMQAPAVMTYGADYTRLDTTSTTTGSTSGQLLLYYPGAVTTGQPFKLQVVMLVEAVHPHNPLDAAAAILGSFTPTVGNPTDRAEMIYLDANAVGWADDKQAFPLTVTDGAYHTYELSVDAAGLARLTVDGAAALTRDKFTTNGTIAIGDQTNDVVNGNVDAILRIRSVRLGAQ